MNKLILVRHGDYSGERLTDWGREDISALAKKLKPMVGRKSVRILTSTAGRARESAEILAEFFGVAHEPHGVLWSDDYHREDFECALELVRLRKGKAGVVILVTHFEYVEDFPRYFGKHELGAEIHSHLIGKGEAWVIDCQEKTLTHVDPR